MYAHVEDGSITYMGTLPTNWRNISGLDKSSGDDVYLKTLGWVPLNETNVTPTYNQKFDTDLITINKDGEGNPTSVSLEHRVRAMTSDEQTQRDADHLAALRFLRTEKLTECDWTMVSDSKLSESKKTEWTTYRQSLRDLPSTADMTKWGTADWVWPTEPS